MKYDEDNDNIVRSILRSEITWVVFLVGGIMAFVSTVILPLQKIQIDVANIQTTLNDSRTLYLQFQDRLGKLEISAAKYHP